MVEKDTSVIPKGCYCYDEKGNCPYWSHRPDLPIQEDGYCDFLGKSDWDINEEIGIMEWKNGLGEVTVTEPHSIPCSLLFEQCKECGINDSIDEYLDQYEGDIYGL